MELFNMKNPKVKKPVKTLAERLKAIRRRPLSPSDVNELNRVFDEIEKEKSDLENDRLKRKIAKPPEADL